jgi:predicted Zn-dependent protease
VHVLRRLILPRLSERLAARQPVMTREQASEISQEIFRLTSAAAADVTIEHTVRSITRVVSDRVQQTNDGDRLRIIFHSDFGNGIVVIEVNQLDKATLQQVARTAETLAKEMIGSNGDLAIRQWSEQDSYPVAPLWHETTIEALRTARKAIVPSIVAPIRQRGLTTSGMIGVLAKAEAVLTKEGITAYSCETDGELSVTARPTDGKTSGWSGAAARNWTAIDPAKIAVDAADICQRNLHPRALEPGRRTAILAPGAVVQLMRFLALHFSGGKSDEGRTGFSKVPDQLKGSRWNEQLFDRRVKITTDPNNPEGSFRPWFAHGLVSNPTTWVDGGVLKYLSYGVFSLKHRKPYAEMPFGFRLHGGETTLEHMIAQCDEGIYVNRFSSVDTIDWHTGMMTGVTSGGCFLVKKGKIERPVKNFRFLVSPFFVLNSLIAMGPSHRTAYGYAPWTEDERDRAGFGAAFDWPRRPMIVPPLMVRDFNFSALVDAV